MAGGGGRWLEMAGGGGRWRRGGGAEQRRARRCDGWLRRDGWRRRSACWLLRRRACLLRRRACWLRRSACWLRCQLRRVRRWACWLRRRRVRPRLRGQLLRHGGHPLDRPCRYRPCRPCRSLDHPCRRLGRNGGGHPLHHPCRRLLPHYPPVVAIVRRAVLRNILKPLLSSGYRPCRRLGWGGGGARLLPHSLPCGRVAVVRPAVLRQILKPRLRCTRRTRRTRRTRCTRLHRRTAASPPVKL